ncbi:MAG: acyl-CoA/acyl-ACP dehydrogenase [Chloroflexi bacterium]|nr:acyl-CoA/acyl-ACP dehydrogenase [Chloroflexota bacterium]
MLTEIRQLAARFAARDAANPDAYPAQNIADLYQAGVAIAPFPPELGGRGATLPDSVAMTEVVAAASPSTALLLSMPLGLAGVYSVGAEAAPPEHRAAWCEQVERIAADYRSHRIYAACNSEKGAGGALSATKTTADRDEQGVFRLTGEKILASFGAYADVFFSTGKLQPEQLPGGGVVEFFLVERNAPGVEVLHDWDGFGMRATESHTVRYTGTPARELMGFPNFIDAAQPLVYWHHLFAAIPLGCAGAILRILGTPAPESPALRLRLSEALMRYEAMRAYLLESAGMFRPAAGPAYATRVLRTKAYVTQEATKLCAELFALGGGRHYTRSGRVARTLADSFAGTALRPPLPLALDLLVQNFTLGLLADLE